MSFVTYNQEVNKQTMQGIYANRLQSSLLKFARSITMQPVSLKLDVVPNAAHMEAPAYSTDTGITICHDATTGSIASANSITRLKGLCVHELAHLLYTPRSRTKLAQWVIKQQHQQAFNILEDNRIENLMVGNLSGVAPWLVHTVTHEFLKDTSATQQAELLPLVWGRKYLPQGVRSSALKAWPHNNAQAVMSVIDEYILLGLHTTAEIDRAKALIAQFASLMFSTHTVKNRNHSHSETCAPASNGSQPVGKRDTDKAMREVQKQVDAQPSAEDMLEGSDGPTGDSGAGSEQRLQNAQAVMDELGKAQSQALSDILDDVKNTIQGIKDVNADTSYAAENDRHAVSPKAIKPIPRTFIKHESPSAESISSSRLFARELQEVRALYDPAWVRKSAQGRLNVRDFVLNGNLEEAFDEWDHGNADVTDIECVILLDNSGSMSNMIMPAYEAMWSIKRALDSIDASTTVIQFGTWGDILYQASERATGRMATARHQGGGSTMPLNSIIRANEILDSSSRAIKMMIVITDGDWGGADKSNQVIATMRSKGILTGLVYLEEPETPEHYKRKDEHGNYLIDAHMCEVAEKLTNPRAIVSFAKAFAKLSQKRLLAV